MITISDLTDAIGKRLTHVLEGGDDYLLLKFEDGTLCQILVLKQDTDFDATEYDERELFATGVIDLAWLAERERLEAEARQKMLQREEKHSREMLAQLKKRFGE